MSTLDDDIDLALLSPRDQTNAVIRTLPYLSSKDLDASLEDNCAICLVPFTTILAEEGSEGDESGITKLTACGHIFCRKDLIAWIRGLHGSCPTCRHIFLDVRPISDSDDESSDGGEYVPDDDVHDTDGLSEFDTELEMDMEMDELWADGDDEYEEGDPIECEEVYESEGEYDDESVDECGEEFMDDDMGLSEGDTSSEMDLGYPVDEIMDDDISITVAGEDTPLYSDNVPEDNDNDK